MPPSPNCQKGVAHPANNWKFRGHKADTQVEKRYLGHPATPITLGGLVRV